MLPRPRTHKALRRKPRSTWAEFLKRVFEIDVLTCPFCGGKRKLIALVTDGKVVRRILEHLGLPTTAPTLAPARSPPQESGEWHARRDSNPRLSDPKSGAGGNRSR